MKIKEFAEAKGIPVKKLVDELRKKFPAKKWSGNDDLQVLEHSCDRLKVKDP